MKMFFFLFFLRCYSWISVNSKPDIFLSSASSIKSFINRFSTSSSYLLFALILTIYKAIFTENVVGNTEALEQREQESVEDSKSILEELDTLRLHRDRENLVESRANHVIQGAINLIHFIRETYTPEQSEELERRLLNSIKNQDIMHPLLQ